MLTKKDLTKKSINENIEQIMECIEYFKEKEEELANQKTGDPIADAFLRYRVRKKICLFGEALALFDGLVGKLKLDLKEWQRENSCREAIAIMWEAMQYEAPQDEDEVRLLEDEFLVFKKGYEAHSKNLK